MSVDAREGRSRNLPYDEDALNSAWRASTKARNRARLERIANQFEELGDVLEFHGDLAGAVRNFERTREIRAELAQRDASNAQRQRALSISLTRLGRVYRKIGDLEAAAWSFQESCKLRSWLVDHYPSDPRCKAELERTHKKLREVEQEQETVKQTRESESRALRAARPEPAKRVFDGFQRLRRIGARWAGTGRSV
jgi:tetratricopeptide (TPR) repeat protein